VTERRPCRSTSNRPRPRRLSSGSRGVAKSLVEAVGGCNRFPAALIENVAAIAAIPITFDGY
jgi:hypothetical protein